MKTVRPSLPRSEELASSREKILKKCRKGVFNSSDKNKSNKLLKKRRKIIKKKRKKERKKTEGQVIHILRDGVVADTPKRKDFKRPVKARPNESVSLICESDIRGH